ncbi:MAG: hypothetical protein BWY63_00848 [Chloroflexi bacterium ADurb.Bin360]|nr:MAG: hypothetical protein BWY63_00848 [Chloroflexi bacterium ADurb.Bin360]
MNTQVNGNIEHPSALRIIHAQEENVTPTAVAQIHAHRGDFTQQREEPIRGSSAEFWTHPQGVIRRMPNAEHPLIAAHRPHTPSHLIRQSLESQPVIGCRQCAGKRLRGTLLRLRREETLNSFLKTAIEQVNIALVGNQSPALQRRMLGQMKAMERVQEEKRPHPFVEILTAAAESLQGAALR